MSKILHTLAHTYAPSTTLDSALPALLTRANSLPAELTICSSPAAETEPSSSSSLPLSPPSPPSAPSESTSSQQTYRNPPVPPPSSNSTSSAPNLAPPAQDFDAPTSFSPDQHASGGERPSADGAKLADGGIDAMERELAEMERRTASIGSGSPL